MAAQGARTWLAQPGQNAVGTEEVMARHLDDSLLLTHGALELSQNQIAKGSHATWQKLNGIRENRENPDSTLLGCSQSVPTLWSSQPMNLNLSWEKSL